MEIEEIEISNKYYPEKLRKIKNPPQKLYILGNKENLNSEGIAIVGSRDCTEKGIQNAKVFSANIAKAGFTIISGMAKGIDAAAHIGALEVGRKNNSCTSETVWITYIQNKIRKYIKEF